MIASVPAELIYKGKAREHAPLCICLNTQTDTQRSIYKLKGWCDIMKNGVKFGVIGDLHVQLTVNGEQNLAEILDACRKEDVDFVIHLGDFCMPEGERKLMADYSVNDRVISMYKNFEKPTYHVIGNHDIDVCTKREILDFWGVPHLNPYYSFDINDYHFVVLDANYMKIGDEFVSYEHGSYYAHSGKAKPVLPFINDEQLEWLKEDLAKTPYPSILFSHQRLTPEPPDAIRNFPDFKKVIDSAPNPVLLAVNGHEHVDFCEKVDKTWYYAVNAAGMQWLTDDIIRTDIYTPEILEQFPYVRHTAPYSKPLYAIITIDEDGATIKGVKGGFVGKSPEEMGIYESVKHYKNGRAYSRFITPSIEDRYLPFK